MSLIKWLVFLIGPSYLIGMWFGEDQRDINKDMCLKEIGPCFHMLIITLNIIFGVTNSNSLAQY
jgi:hypothetical protein